MTETLKELVERQSQEINSGFRSLDASWRDKIAEVVSHVRLEMAEWIQSDNENVRYYLGGIISELKELK